MKFILYVLSALFLMGIKDTSAAQIAATAFDQAAFVQYAQEQIQTSNVPGVVAGGQNVDQLWIMTQLLGALLLLGVLFSLN